MSPFTLSNGVRACVVDFVRGLGARGVETGGFLLASRGSDTATVVAIAGTTGVIRHRDFFQISDLALDALFAYADQNDLWIPAQFHSHCRVAELSLCDIKHGLSVEDFVSTIVPFFAEPPAAVAAWGWWRYDGGWRGVPAPAVTSEVSALTVTFDENGGREEGASGS